MFYLMVFLGLYKKTNKKFKQATETRIDYLITEAV